MFNNLMIKPWADLWKQAYQTKETNKDNSILAESNNSSNWIKNFEMSVSEFSISNNTCTLSITYYKIDWSQVW